MRLSMPKKNKTKMKVDNNITLEADITVSRLGHVTLLNSTTHSRINRNIYTAKALLR